MNEEEIEAIENHFANALNDIVSGIKDSDATEIVMRQKSMILFYKRVMLEIEKRDELISKLQKELDKKNKVINIATKQIEKYKEIIDDLTEGEEDCFIPDTYSNIDDCVKKKTCADCIKEYFYKQVEDK